MLTKPEDIFTIFRALNDPRQQAKVEHRLDEMIFMTLCGALCGIDTFTDLEEFINIKRDWFDRYLTLEKGVPSHDTFGRVFARLDTAEFYECLQEWIASLAICLQGQGVHVDGKTLRRSFDSSDKTKAIKLVSAWAGEAGLCLGQRAVEDDSNEITAVPQLLQMLEISGAIVTLDAMHCQKETVRTIREKGADYVLTVKGNQAELKTVIETLFEKHVEDGGSHSQVRTLRTKESSHGREELRIYTVAPAPAILRRQGWVDVRTVGMVYRSRCVNGKESQEVVYFISSLPPKVRALAKHVRDHWKVENQLHWSLDVTFAEDECRIRKGVGAEIAGVFRRIALSMLKRNTTRKKSLRAKRLIAGWDERFLEELLSGK